MSATSLFSRGDLGPASEADLPGYDPSAHSGSSRQASGRKVAPPFLVKLPALVTFQRLDDLRFFTPSPR